MFKNIIKYSSFGYRRIFKIFGIKISYYNRKRGLNKFIPLGINCFPRVILTINNFKNRKTDGELTYPFDLCVIDFNSIAKILENDFADLYNDLVYDENHKQVKWVNKKYNIYYPHDNELKTKDEFMKRYNKRIEQFKNILKIKNNLVFISCLFFDKQVYASTINSIYKSLCRYTNGHKFNYYIANLCENNVNLLIKDEEINKNVVYQEIIVEKDFSKFWGDEIFEKSPRVMKTFNDMYYTLKELIKV